MCTACVPSYDYLYLTSKGTMRFKGRGGRRPPGSISRKVRNPCCELVGAVRWSDGHGERWRLREAPRAIELLTAPVRWRKQGEEKAVLVLGLGEGIRNGDLAQGRHNGDLAQGRHKCGQLWTAEVISVHPTKVGCLKGEPETATLPWDELAEKSCLPIAVRWDRPSVVARPRREAFPARTRSHPTHSPDEC